MSNAEATFELYKKLGILTDVKSLQTIFNREKKWWEIWGHFQNQNGRRNGKIAEFDDVADAVDFTRLADPRYN